MLVGPPGTALGRLAFSGTAALGLVVTGVGFVVGGTGLVVGALGTVDPGSVTTGTLCGGWVTATVVEGSVVGGAVVGGAVGYVISSGALPAMGICAALAAVSDTWAPSRVRSC